MEKSNEPEGQSAQKSENFVGDKLRARQAVRCLSHHCRALVSAKRCSKDFQATYVYCRAAAQAAQRPFQGNRHQDFQYDSQVSHAHAYCFAFRACAPNPWMVFPI